MLDPAQGLPNPDWPYLQVLVRLALSRALGPLLPLALKYGFVFLVLHVLGELAQRQFGELVFYFVSVVGGRMSSASAVAAAATLASRGTLPPDVTAAGVIGMMIWVRSIRSCNAGS